MEVQFLQSLFLKGCVEKEHLVECGYDYIKRHSAVVVDYVDCVNSDNLKPCLRVKKGDRFLFAGFTLHAGYDSG